MKAPKLFLEFAAKGKENISRAFNQFAQQSAQAGTQAGKAFSQNYQRNLQQTLLTGGFNTSQQDYFLKQKSKVMGTRFDGGKPFFNPALLAKNRPHFESAIDSFVLAKGKMDMQTALSNPQVLVSRMGAGNAAKLHALISKDYDKRMSGALYASIQQAARSGKLGSTDKLVRTAAQVGLTKRLAGPWRFSQQNLNDLSRGRFGNLTYGLGGMMPGMFGNVLAGGAGALIAGTGFVKNLSDRSETYRQIKAYIGSENPGKVFDNELRDIMNQTAIRYGLAIEDVSSFVIESLQSGVDTKSIRSMLPSVASIARNYNVPMQEMVELMTTAQLSDWIDPNDVKSVTTFFGRLIEMVRISKGTISGFAQSLKYTPALREAGVDANSYMSIYGILANNNIAGTRAGRTMDAVFGKILVPDSKAADIKSNLLGALTDNGRESAGVSEENLEKLSEYFAALQFTIYNKSGELDVGQGKRYVNWNEAIADLGNRIKNMTTAEKNVMFSKFNQIGKRGAASVLGDPQKLNEMFDKIVGADVLKNIEITQQVTDESLSGATARLGQTFKSLTDSFLKLEENISIVKASVDFFSGVLSWVNGLAEKFGILTNQRYRTQSLAKEASGDMSMDAITLTAFQNLQSKGFIQSASSINAEQSQALKAEYERIKNELSYKTFNNPLGYTQELKKLSLQTEGINISAEDYNSLRYYTLNDEQKLQALQASKKIGMIENSQWNQSVMLGNFFEREPEKKLISSLTQLGINPSYASSLSAMGQQPVGVEGEVKLVIENKDGVPLGQGLIPLRSFGAPSSGNPAVITLNGLNPQGARP